ncbi:MAG: helicase-related protein [Alphaproteobacteria bacterium]
MTAVLGPTNTGKTFFALERLVTFQSGIIGFPLRLLARENYDRLVQIKGAAAVALITGEEKICPPTARYFVCTVESMPMDRPVECMVVDEIQLCADPERGHVFTERLLHARGSCETLFLGAATIAPLIKRLLPAADIIERPRLSSLTYAGSRKISRLPSRTAVVAFSMDSVYEVAELVRRTRGGTALILGALSPRTRNAQVAMYQAGEVDYLVATDAIGMGLNMDIQHVAFAETRKFDGGRHRPLLPAEMAQVAGRAGRYLTAGTFGVTHKAEGLDPALVQQLENHEFAQLQQIYWRNHKLQLHSPQTLLDSLQKPSPFPFLIRQQYGQDHLALRGLLRNPQLAARCTSPDATSLLWDICQIPDFRKTLSEVHIKLLEQLYGFLLDKGNIPFDWMASHINQLDNPRGDMDTLMGRIAHIRTFTYIAHRHHWLKNAEEWQIKTRKVEDNLSDALHERLTQHFVDRAKRIYGLSSEEAQHQAAYMDEQGQIFLDNMLVGRINGLSFTPMAAVSPFLLEWVKKLMPQQLEKLLLAIKDPKICALTLLGDRLLWQNMPIARLVRGDNLYQPNIKLLEYSWLDDRQIKKLQEALQLWLNEYLAKKLAPIISLQQQKWQGASRGIVFQLVEALGVLPRKSCTELLSDLSSEDRRTLYKAGVRIGSSHIFLPRLEKAATRLLRGVLWAIWQRQQSLSEFLMPEFLITLSPQKLGGAIMPMDNAPVGYWQAMGFVAVNNEYWPIDRLEKFAVSAHQQLKKSDDNGRYRSPQDLAAIFYISNEQAENGLKWLGWQQYNNRWYPKPYKKAGTAKKNAHLPLFRGLAVATPPINPNQPFAVLQQLVSNISYTE